MLSPTTPAKTRKATASAQAPTPTPSPNDLVPLSLDVPRYVRDHLQKAAGIASRAAKARQVLTDWSEANKVSR